MTLLQRLQSIFGTPWFVKPEMGQDQIKRRLSSIRTQRLELAADIQKARRQKKSRKSLYAEMEALTTEALKLEGMLK